MAWVVEFHKDFLPEFAALDQTVQTELLSHAKLLRELGPTLGRPRVDTLNGSRYPNMKELRFNVDNGVWRVAFAFDPNRQAILLVAGDKLGMNQGRFYERLIAKADLRFNAHLQALRSK